MMNITYDRATDAAIIWLKKPSLQGNEVLTSYVCEELPEKVQGDINLDFDNQGMLRSIEILYASKVLSKDLLRPEELENL